MIAFRELCARQFFQQAAEYATKVGQDRLISTSRSSDRVAGVVTVWYWSKAE